MKKVIFVGCAATKAEGTHLAKDLYTSSYFKKKMAYAEMLNGDIYILSAKHHLLDPNKEVEYYDLKLKDLDRNGRREWAKEVYKEIKEKGIDVDNTEFVFLAGKDYFVDLAPMLPNCSFPLKGKGIGEQNKFLKENIGGK